MNTIIILLIGVFIGICCSVMGFIISMELHYTDAEIYELYQECGVNRKDDGNA